MNDIDGVGKVLQAATALLEALGLFLSKLGVELPLLVLQLFGIAVLAGLSWPLIKRVRAGKAAERLPPIWLVVPGLAALGIVFGIADNATTPSRVGGTVKAAPGTAPRAELLDYLGRRVSIDSGAIDSVNGAVALHYSPLWEGQARKLRLSATGCVDQDLPLARVQLRASSDFVWEHQCTRR